MKNLILPNVFLAMFTMMLLNSCSQIENYKTSAGKIEKLRNDSIITHQMLDECYAQSNNLSNENISLQDKNDSVRSNLDKLSTSTELTINDQKIRLTELNKSIELQKEVMTNLKTVLSKALLSYKSDELTVYTKNGKVYVSLEEKLLFKSGSDIVDPKGKEALKSVVKVLNETKNVSVMVEGHTDNIPIHTKDFQDNWELSTARATSILRIMTADYGFNSYKIIASGRANFCPVKSNKTPQGRAGNRRTEIILSPDLKDVYSLLK